MYAEETFLRLENGQWFNFSNSELNFNDLEINKLCNFFADFSYFEKKN